MCHMVSYTPKRIHSVDILAGSPPGVYVLYYRVSKTYGQSSIIRLLDVVVCS